MNVTRITGLHRARRVACALTACGGGGAPTTTQRRRRSPTSHAPTPTPDPRRRPPMCRRSQVNFWNNVRVQNRCGQCHNATSPAQMPNFARSDDVNLAYAQANTVVNLGQPVDLAASSPR